MSLKSSEQAQDTGARLYVQLLSNATFPSNKRSVSPVPDLSAYCVLAFVASPLEDARPQKTRFLPVNLGQDWE